jgi:hypothetical protein
LVGPPPRQLPDSFSEGRPSVRRRRAFWGCLAAGVACFTLAPLPFVKTLSLYLLPLGYLTWIGLAIFIFGLIAYLRAADVRQAARYIQYGEVSLAPVVGLVKTPTAIVNGVPARHAIVATLNLNLDRDAPLLCEVKSTEIMSDWKDLTDARFRVGDRVPIVWMSGELQKTVQIYDFLEATPESCLVRRSLTEKTPMWQLILAAALIPLLFLLLFWNVYAMGRYGPIDFDYLRQGGVPFAVGGAAGAILCLWSFRLYFKKRRLQEGRNRAAAASGEAIDQSLSMHWLKLVGMGLVLLTGSILICGATVLCWAFTANALLDKSPSKPVPVRITEMIQTTHGGIFREYQMKFRRAGDKKNQSLLSTPDHMDQFVVPVGNALVREGRFGWPWVETIEPVIKLN